MRVVQVDEHQDADQHEQAAEHGEDEELHGRVDPARPAPDADHQVHRDQHHLPDDVEEEEVQCEEGAEHPGLQRQHVEDVLLHAAADLGPGREQHHGEQERGQHDQEAADAVDGQVVVDAVVGDPLGVLYHLEPALGCVETRPEDEREQQSDERRAQRDDLPGLLGEPRDEALDEHQERHDRDRQEDHQRQQVVAIQAVENAGHPRRLPRARRPGSGRRPA